MDDNQSLFPTTELDAVNEMLFVVGESPVDTLEQDTITEAGKALTILRRESRVLQIKGWAFNTDEGVNLLPSSDGTIPLPAGFLSIKFRPYATIPSLGADLPWMFPTGPLSGCLTARAGQVYNRVLQTFVIGVPVCADIVQLLSFDDLPEAAKNYIFVRATRRFQDGTLGDDALHKFEQTDEAEAWAEFLQRETEDCHYNINRDSPSVRRVTVGRYRYMS